MKQIFTTATPEQVGISSQHIINFMQRLADYNICMHGIIIVRDGKLVTETYYAPYKAETMHRMFSVTKSFSAIGIGLLVGEGKLSLDDFICDHFPEKLPPKGVHPYIAQTTIRDMLMMATAHDRTTYKRFDGDWVKSFFHIEPNHVPGTVFSYDTSSSHTLAALVEKLSGMSLLDYMRSNFLAEIGFSKTAYALTDPAGITQGGSGLMATPMDLAKVAWILLREGEYQGKQYLPREFVKEATANQIETSVRGGNIYEQQGYGYQFWRVPNNGYAMFGMGGQLAACFPDEDLLFVTTADTLEHNSGVPIIWDAFFAEIFSKLEDQPLPENPDGASKLKKICIENQIQTVKGISTQTCASDISSKTYNLDENSMGFTKIRLDLSADRGTFYYQNKTGDHELPFGIDELALGNFPYYNYFSATSGNWISPQCFVIKSNIIDEEIGMLTIQLAFKDNTITMVMKKSIPTDYKEFTGFVSGTY